MKNISDKIDNDQPQPSKRLIKGRKLPRIHLKNRDQSPPKWNNIRDPQLSAGTFTAPSPHFTNLSSQIPMRGYNSVYKFQGYNPPRSQHPSDYNSPYSMKPYNFQKPQHPNLPPRLAPNDRNHYPEPSPISYFAHQRLHPPNMGMGGGGAFSAKKRPMPSSSTLHSNTYSPAVGFQQGRYNGYDNSGGERHFPKQFFSSESLTSFEKSMKPQQSRRQSKAKMSMKSFDTDDSKKKGMNRKESKNYQDKITSLMVSPEDLLDFYKKNFSERVVDLSFHIYGNFVVQKFLETQNIRIYDDILEKIGPKIVDLSNNKYACRIIQIMLYRENLSNELTNTLQKRFNLIAIDENGSFVLQKYLKLCPKQVIYSLRKNIIELNPLLKTNPHLSKPVQIYFYRLTPEETKEVLEEVSIPYQDILFCSHGNYLLQELIKKANQTFREKLETHCLDNIHSVATDKTASNVLEQLILNSEANYAENIVKWILPDFYETMDLDAYENGKLKMNYSEVDKVLSPSNNGDQNEMNDDAESVDSKHFKSNEAKEKFKTFQKIVSHKYGNFVFQTIFKNLRRCQKEISGNLLLYIKDVDPNLMSQYFASHFINLLKRMAKPDESDLESQDNSLQILRSKVSIQVDDDVSSILLSHPNNTIEELNEDDSVMDEHSVKYDEKVQEIEK